MGLYDSFFRRTDQSKGLSSVPSYTLKGSGPIEDSISLTSDEFKAFAEVDEAWVFDTWLDLTREFTECGVVVSGPRAAILEIRNRLEKMKVR